MNVLNRTLVASMAIGATVVLGVVWALRTPSPVESNVAAAWDPLSRIVQVEVLNAGAAIGAARVATEMLRDGRLDVVYYGNADSTWRRATRNTIVVRRGDTLGVGRAREVLGSAEVVERDDRSRLVDLTIILGRDFRGRPRAR